MRDFNQRLADKLGVSLNKASSISKTFIATLNEYVLDEGKKLNFRGFGTFHKADVPSTNKKIPGTDKIVTTKPYYTVRFRPSKANRKEK